MHDFLSSHTYTSPSHQQKPVEFCSAEPRIGLKWVVDKHLPQHASEFIPHKTSCNQHTCMHHSMCNTNGRAQFQDEILRKWARGVVLDNGSSVQHMQAHSPNQG